MVGGSWPRARRWIELYLMAEWHWGESSSTGGCHYERETPRRAMGSSGLKMDFHGGCPWDVTYPPALLPLGLLCLTFQSISQLQLRKKKAALALSSRSHFLSAYSMNETLKTTLTMPHIDFASGKRLYLLTIKVNEGILLGSMTSFHLSVSKYQLFRTDYQCGRSARSLQSSAALKFYLCHFRMSDLVSEVPP